MSGPRTGKIGADVAFETPDQIPVDLICGYSGAAAKSRAQIDAWARPYLPGFESSTTRSYAGGNGYGAADADQLAGYLDSIAAPKDCGYWFCAADSPSTPGQYVSNITDYGADFVGRMRARGYVGPAMPYGNPTAVEAAVAGVLGAGSVALRWGVGTWGYGEGGGANQPPDSSTADLLQSGNTPGPAPGTDLDWLYAPVEAFCAINGPAAPAPPQSKESTMLVGLHKRPDGNFDAELVDGGVQIHAFTGPMATWGFVAAPQDAQDFSVNTNTPPFFFTDAEWAEIAQRSAVALMAPGSGGGGASGPTPEQVAAVQALIAAEADNTAAAAAARAAFGL